MPSPTVFRRGFGMNVGELLQGDGKGDGAPFRFPVWTIRQHKVGHQVTQQYKRYDFPIRLVLEAGISATAAGGSGGSRSRSRSSSRGRGRGRAGTAASSGSSGGGAGAQAHGRSKSRQRSQASADSSSSSASAAAATAAAPSSSSLSSSSGSSMLREAAAQSAIAAVQRHTLHGQPITLYSHYGNPYDCVYQGIGLDGPVGQAVSIDDGSETVIVALKAHGVGIRNTTKPKGAVASSLQKR